MKIQATRNNFPKGEGIFLNMTKKFFPARKKSLIDYLRVNNYGQDIKDNKIYSNK